MQAHGHGHVLVPSHDHGYERTVRVRVPGLAPDLGPVPGPVQGQGYVTQGHEQDRDLGHAPVQVLGLLRGLVRALSWIISN